MRRFLTSFRPLAFASFVAPFVSFVVLSVIFVSTGCSAPPAQAERAPQETAWRSVGSWTGSGNRQTESFDVTNGSLRVTWDARAAVAGSGTPRLRVSLYSAISGRPLQTVVDVQQAGSGSAYAADDPRVSYLVIEAEHLDWRVGLDEALLTH